jgi:Protein of unknown function (DUF1631)
LEQYQNTTSPALARVPPPLREALQDLQTMLEKLAVHEPSLLQDGNHPARAMLEAIVQRSLGFSTEMAEGFVTFMSPVTKVFEALQAQAQPQGRMFAQALASLTKFWQHQDSEKALSEERKQRELAMVDTRKQLAGRLAFELVSRRDAGDAPVPVKQFLMGPWSQVLARAQLYPQFTGDADRYTACVAALLWSVSHRRAGVRKPKLTALIPSLLPALKDGLNSIEQHASLTDQFMNELAKLHEAVMAASLSAEEGTPGNDLPPAIPVRGQ